MGWSATSIAVPFAAPFIPVTTALPRSSPPPPPSLPSPHLYRLRRPPSPTTAPFVPFTAPDRPVTTAPFTAAFTTAAFIAFTAAFTAAAFVAFAAS